MRLFKLFAFLLFLLAAVAAHAQTSINVDSLLLQAHKAVQEGNYNKGRTLAGRVLKLAPAYTDAAILIGNTYTWEQKYDSADAVLQPLLTSAPPHAEVYQALAQLALLSGQKPETVLAYADRGLAIAPDSQVLMEYKFRALVGLKKYEEANLLLESMPQKSTRYHAGRELLDDLTKINTLRTDYQITAFNKEMPNWHLASVEYTRQIKPGSITGRINYTNRFEQNALQGEVDFWPVLNEKTYLYLNAGFSTGQLFPDYRTGVEVYRKLPQSFEASLGTRTLVFPDETVWLFTGHIGKYLSKYWVAFRPFVQYQQGELQTTGILQLRRYLQDESQHLTLTLSKGSTPATQIGLQEINRLDASRIGLESRFKLGSSFYWGALLQYEYEEFAEASFRSRYTTGLSLQYRFK